MSSETLSLRHQSREERLLKKRKLQQENMTANANVSTADEKLPFVETTTPLKRNRKSFKKVKVENVVTSNPHQSSIKTDRLSSSSTNQVSVQSNNHGTPIQEDLKPTTPRQQVIPSQQANPPTSIHQIVKVNQVNVQLPTQPVMQTHQLTNNLQTPAQQVIQMQRQLPNSIPNQSIQQQPQQQPQQQQQQQQSDTILLRLANGQVIRVPRSMLKKVNPATSNTSREGIPNIVTVSGTSTLPVTGVPIAVRSTGQTSSSTASLPTKAPTNQALQILTQKYPDRKIVYQTNNPIVAVPKPNGTPVASNSGSNGQTFRLVRIQSPQLAQQTLNGSTTATSAMPQQLFRMGPNVTTAQHTFVTQQPQTVSAASPFNVSRIVQQQHRTVVMPTSAPVPPVVQQTRPTLQQFVTTSNGVQQSGQGPMKICIIHSPRKADGSPHPSGSAAPQILVMNPPSNLQQINFNEVLKAISMQNAATTNAHQKS